MKRMIVLFSLLMVVTAVQAQTTLFSCDFETDDCGAIYESDAGGARWLHNSFNGCPGSGMHHSYESFYTDRDYVVWGPFTLPSADYLQLRYDLSVYNCEVSIFTICDVYLDPNTNIGSWSLVDGPVTTNQACVPAEVDISSILSACSTEFWIAWEFESDYGISAGIDNIEIVYGTGSTPTPTATAVPLTGDTCSDPFIINCGDCVTGSTSGFSNDYDANYPNGIAHGPDAVYSLTITEQTWVEFRLEADFWVNFTVASTCDISAHDILYPFSSECDVSMTCGGFDFPARAFDSAVVLNPGTYFIWIDSYYESFGNYALEVNCVTGSTPVPTATPSPVPNERCTDALDITSVPFSFSFDNELNTTDGAGSSCSAQYTPGISQMKNDVWFRYSPSVDCYLDFQATSRCCNLAVMVYRGETCSFKEEVICSDLSMGYSYTEQIGFYAMTGETYWIQLGTPGYSTGKVFVSLGCNPGMTPTPTQTPIPIPGDSCLVPLPILENDCVIGSTAGKKANCSYRSISDFEGLDVVYELNLTDTMSVHFLGEAEYDASWLIAADCSDLNNALYVSSGIDDDLFMSCGGIFSNMDSALDTTLSLPPGDYFVVVDGYTYSSGNYALEIQSVATGSPTPTITPTEGPTLTPTSTPTITPTYFPHGCTGGNTSSERYIAESFIQEGDRYFLLFDPCTECDACSNRFRVTAVYARYHHYGSDYLSVSTDSSIYSAVETFPGSGCYIPDVEIYNDPYTSGNVAVNPGYFTVGGSFMGTLPDLFCPGPYFLSITLLEYTDLPINLVTDLTPISCRSYLERDGVLTELVQDHGAFGNWSAYAQVQCLAPLPTATPTRTPTVTPTPTHTATPTASPTSPPTSTPTTGPSPTPLPVPSTTAAGLGTLLVAFACIFFISLRKRS